MAEKQVLESLERLTVALKEFSDKGRLNGEAMRRAVRGLNNRHYAIRITTWRIRNRRRTGRG